MILEFIDKAIEVTIICTLDGLLTKVISFLVFGLERSQTSEFIILHTLGTLFHAWVILITLSVGWAGHWSHRSFICRLSIPVLFICILMRNWIGLLHSLIFTFMMDVNGTACLQLRGLLFSMDLCRFFIWSNNDSLYDYFCSGLHICLYSVRRLVNSEK